MSADQTFPTPADFAAHLKRLRAARNARVEARRALPLERTPLTNAERQQVLEKSGGRCHICGGPITGPDWQADHVFAHSAGGPHSLDNYLPAHALCNNYRWHYDTEEFQWILKLGVWLRTQIETETAVGQSAAKDFIAHERRRSNRRRSRGIPAAPLKSSAATSEPL